MYDRIIFVAQTGNCREPMAAGILRNLMPASPIDILARGLVVQFPEPMNQKAEAVLISHGITTEGFSSVALSGEDLTDGTLVCCMESVHRSRVLDLFPDFPEEQVVVLSFFVGDELEAVDPYGAPLANYGLCYESLRADLVRLRDMLKEPETK